MKEAIGGTWLFGIVITFIVFFTTFISFSTNYSRAFNVKDEVLTIIERYKGLNETSVGKINKRLSKLGYTGYGKCTDYSGEANYESDNYSHWLGFKHSSLSGVENSKNNNYCVRRYLISSPNNGPIGHPTAAYYQVVVFFKLDWPVVGDVFELRVEGETAVIHAFNDTYWPIS